MSINENIPDWSPGEAMSPEQIKVYYQQLYDDVWNKGDLDAIGFLYPYDFKYIHVPSAPWPTLDLESIGQLVSTYRTAFPDVHVTIEEQILDQNPLKIVTRWTAHGTHNGELFDIPPTGKQVIVTGIAIRHLFIDRAGRAVNGEMWVNWDMLGLLQQLGIAPAPTTRGEDAQA